MKNENSNLEIDYREINEKLTIKTEEITQLKSINIDLEIKVKNTEN